MGTQLDVMEEGYVDHELFSLSNIKVYFHLYVSLPIYCCFFTLEMWTSEICLPLYVNQGKNDLRAVDSTEYDDDNVELGEHENDVTKDKNRGSSASDIDSDEERRRFAPSLLLNSVNFFRMK